MLDYPEAGDVNSSKILFTDLTDSEKSILNYLISKHQHKVTIVKYALSVLNKVKDYIQTTISKPNQAYINKKTLIYQMLVALKSRLALTN
jgi:hypothetical protein